MRWFLQQDYNTSRWCFISFPRFSFCRLSWNCTTQQQQQQPYQPFQIANDNNDVPLLLCSTETCCLRDSRNNVWSYLSLVKIFAQTAFLCSNLPWNRKCINNDLIAGITFIVGAQRQNIDEERKCFIMKIEIPLRIFARDNFGFNNRRRKGWAAAQARLSNVIRQMT